MTVKRYSYRIITMKKSLVIIIILLLIVLGGIAYFLRSNKPPQSQTAKEENQPTSAPLTKNSLIDLLAQGKNQSCTYSTTTANNTESSGTVYISGKNMRADFAVTVEGKKNTGSMVRDENFSYIWGMGMAQGIKMKNSAVESPSSITQNSQNFDPNAKVDYKCVPWTPNNSVFTPPTDIKFSEFSLPSPQAAKSSENPTTNNQAACAACNSLSGQAKTMCLAQLNCQ